ncbi:MAG: hypothetical protein ACRDWA_16880 [Acidimicrobiia bacterium]
MSWGRLLALCALCVFGLSCADNQSAGEQGTDLPEGNADPHALGVVAEAVEGQPTKGAALEAFAIAFGPLPGVETPDFEEQPYPSGTGPLRWVLSHWDFLTQEQKSAVEEYAGAELQARAPIQMGFGFSAASSGVDSVALLGLVEQVKTQIAAKLGRELTVDIELVIAPQSNSEGAFFWTQAQSPTGSTKGDMTKCRITIGEPGIPFASQIDSAGAASPTLTGLVAHEVFHCFDFDLSSIQASLKRPMWVVEGLADWVALDLVGQDLDSEAFGVHWSGWFHQHDVSLFKRTYSAVGFFTHLAETGTEIWSGIDDLLVDSEGGNVAGYQSITAVAGPSFLDTWAASLVRDVTRAPEWDSEGPGVPDNLSAVPSPVEPLVEGERRLLEAESYAAAVLAIDLEADVVFVSGVGSGMALLPDGASLSFSDVHGAALCTRDEGCTCPDGSPGAGVVFRLVPRGSMVVAVTGGPSGIPEGLQGYSLESFCEQAVEDCLVGAWVSLRWEVPQVDTAYGAGTMIMRIDRSGDVTVEFDPGYPLFALASGEGAVPVRMEFSGNHSFKMGRGGVAPQGLGGDAMVTSWADIGDAWVQTSDPIELSESSLGYVGDSQFICEGEDLRVRSQGGDIVFGPWPG